MHSFPSVDRYQCDIVHSLRMSITKQWNYNYMHIEFHVDRVCHGKTVVDVGPCRGHLISFRRHLHCAHMVCHIPQTWCPWNDMLHGHIQLQCLLLSNSFCRLLLAMTSYIETRTGSHMFSFTTCLDMNTFTDLDMQWSWTCLWPGHPCRPCDCMYMSTVIFLCALKNGY